MNHFSLDHLPQGEIVRENVKKEISQNTLLKNDNILVDAEGDEIILLGMVDSLDKKWLAEDIAHDTFGVLHVKNNIHVNEQIESRGDFYEN